MKSYFRLLPLALAVCAIGCSSGGGGPTLAPVDGEVTYMNKPIAGATVMFIPEKGPLALGITDAEGKFRLSTGTTRGVVLGSSRATVTVPEAAAKEVLTPPKTQAEADAYMKKINAMQQARIGTSAASQKPASLIPEKYGKPDTSGLSYTVKAGSNHFKLELQ